jgi:hypothetical protein
MENGGEAITVLTGKGYDWYFKYFSKFSYSPFLEGICMKTRIWTTVHSTWCWIIIITPVLFGVTTVLITMIE